MHAKISKAYLDCSAGGEGALPELSPCPHIVSAPTVIAFSIVAKSFFSVDTITHEQLHLSWWTFAQTTTSRSLLNIKVINQTLRSHGFLCAWYCLNQLVCIHETLHRHGPRAVLSLEQGLTSSCCCCCWWKAGYVCGVVHTVQREQQTDRRLCLQHVFPLAFHHPGLYSTYSSVRIRQWRNVTK